MHLPKCAGTSLVRTFSQLGRSRYVLVSRHQRKSEAVASIEKQILTHQVKRENLDLIMGRDAFYGVHEEYSDRPPFYFTFLRDPVERYVSQWRFYHDAALDPQHKAHAVGLDRLSVEGKQLSLPEFVEAEKEGNSLCRVLGSVGPDQRSNDHYWNTNGEEAFRYARNTLACMDFIGLVESFTEDARVICRCMGIGYRFKKANASRAEVRLDPPLLKKIRRINELDIQLYEEAKELKSQTSP